MRVLVAPGLDLSSGERASLVAAALAGEGGTVVELARLGLPVLGRRPLSAAEVASIREGLDGGPAQPSAGEGRAVAVGYVCGGRALGAAEPAQIVAVTDHAGLTWLSPLSGPNDDTFGPRFPRVDGVYRPQVVEDRVRALPGVTITSARVAGVHDDEAPSDWEREMMRSLAIPVMSTALVPVAVIAAHMGLRVAAAVLL